MHHECTRLSKLGSGQRGDPVRLDSHARAAGVKTRTAHELYCTMARALDEHCMKSARILARNRRPLLCHPDISLFLHRRAGWLLTDATHYSRRLGGCSASISVAQYALADILAHRARAKRFVFDSVTFVSAPTSLLARVPSRRSVASKSGPRWAYQRDPRGARSRGMTLGFAGDRRVCHLPCAICATARGSA